MSDQAAQQPPCEHYWAYLVHDGLSVRLCQLCHEPDWEDLKQEMDKAFRLGRDAQREADAALADQLGVRYLYIEPVVQGRGYMPGCSIRFFGERLREHRA